jgi:2-keto-4-pentenoate hydratase/2-oxohepta-3-ene-1,7-dioic acid hydratase in catechol pathway
MRIASFRHGSVESYGIVVDDAVVDVGAALRPRYPTLRAVLAADALDDVSSVANEAVRLNQQQITFLPTIPDAGKVICSGVNYRAHADEAGVPIPARPIFFSRFTDSLVGHGQPLIRPAISEQLDWEGELCAIIGRDGRYIPEEHALSHVAGFACFLDGSVRDFQQESLFAGKNFWASGGLGPWLTTADDVPDPGRLTIVTRLNGRQMQHGTTDTMVFSIARLISYASTITPLAPGDVIVTGTPSGVGMMREPPIWIRPGDLVEVEISGVGTLSHPVVAEAAHG